MKRNRGDILTVSKRLGPSKSSVTLDIYGHIVPGIQEKAAAIMDEIATPVTMESMQTALGLVTFFRKSTETIPFFDIYLLKDTISLPYGNGPLAQLAEQLTLNQKRRACPATEGRAEGSSCELLSIVSTQ